MQQVTLTDFLSLILRKWTFQVPWDLAAILGCRQMLLIFARSWSEHYFSLGYHKASKHWIRLFQVVFQCLVFLAWDSSFILVYLPEILFMKLGFLILESHNWKAHQDPSCSQESTQECVVYSSKSTLSLSIATVLTESKSSNRTNECTLWVGFWKVIQNKY